MIIFKKGARNNKAIYVEQNQYELYITGRIVSGISRKVKGRKLIIKLRAKNRMEYTHIELWRFNTLFSENFLSSK